MRGEIMSEQSEVMGAPGSVGTQGDPTGQHGARVTVIYNGLGREIEFRPRDQVSEIRGRAMAAFGISQNQHLLALWTEGGVELPDDKTAHDAGIQPHDKLLLRPSAVRGGAQG
jgi:hypothetical protein